jgi:hypothetical protein
VDSYVSRYDDALAVVRMVAQLLARAANVVVVSDPTAGLVFAHERRVRFVWVDGMSAVEARTYARTLDPAVTEGDLELLFDKVGRYSPRRHQLLVFFLDLVTLSLNP